MSDTTKLNKFEFTDEEAGTINSILADFGNMVIKHIRDHELRGEKLPDDDLAQGMKFTALLSKWSDAYHGNGLCKDPECGFKEKELNQTELNND